MTSAVRITIRFLAIVIGSVNAIIMFFIWLSGDPATWQIWGCAILFQFYWISDVIRCTEGDER